MATEAVHGQAEEVRVDLPQQRPPAQTELVVTTRPSPAETIADPGPLGLACFALTTFVLSVFNADLFGQTAAMKTAYLPLALIYGGGAQLLAGMWEFKKNNTFGAVAFTSYGAFWISLALLGKFFKPGIVAAGGAGAYDTALAITLLSWTIFTAYMLVGSFRTNKALASVFSVLMVTFVFLIFFHFNPHTAWLEEWAGYLGIVTACLAWYTSAAGILNPMYGRTVLPTGPFKK